jgi:hypothetical protein
MDMPCLLASANWRHPWRVELHHLVETLFIGGIAKRVKMVGITR